MRAMTISFENHISWNVHTAHWSKFRSGIRSNSLCGVNRNVNASEKKKRTKSNNNNTLHRHCVERLGVGISHEKSKRFHIHRMFCITEYRSTCACHSTQHTYECYKWRINFPFFAIIQHKPQHKWASIIIFHLLCELSLVVAPEEFIRCARTSSGLMTTVHETLNSFETNSTTIQQFRQFSFK